MGAAAYYLFGVGGVVGIMTSGVLFIIGWSSWTHARNEKELGEFFIALKETQEKEYLESEEEDEQSFH